MSIDDVRRIADTVEGYLRDEEGPLLYELARRQASKGAVVEIGSWKGKSTVWIAKGIEASGARTPFYAIDPHTGSTEHREQFGSINTFAEFQANIERAGVASLVTPLVQPSETAAALVTQPIALIFIDGAHEYSAVRRDFEIWFPKVIEDGVMAFHDTTRWPGPERLVRQAIYTSRSFRAVHFVQSITYATKVRQNSLSDRVRAAAMLGCKAVYGRTSVLPVPASFKRAARAILSTVNPR